MCILSGYEDPVIFGHYIIVVRGVEIAKLLLHGSSLNLESLYVASLPLGDVPIIRIYDNPNIFVNVTVEIF